MPIWESVKSFLGLASLPDGHEDVLIAQIESFFIDKYAGCDRLLRKDGTAVLAERTERGFHYSDLPSKEYRSRIGYLAFSCGAGTVAFVATGR